MASLQKPHGEPRKRTSAGWLLLLALALIMAGQGPALASPRGDGAKQAVVRRLQHRITIDGVLDEPDWAEALPIGDLVQREPHQGEPATEATSVRLLFDSNYLYIGVACLDSQPRQIVATQMARDADITADDSIEILIDTFRDRRNAYYFATNPLGALVDGLIIENGQLNREWDAIWDVRVRRSESGWAAEFAIPFKSLGFHAGVEAWGFNIQRTVKRKLEQDRWSAARFDVKFYQVSEAGEITGFREINQGRGLDVRPYVSSKARRGGDAGSEFTAKAGADIFYNLTPSLKWTTTINTDFAETEVDSRQINLTRFPLFFPEKRAFFLENTGVFNFANGNASNDVLPFFSRRIGLFEGREVPIVAGTKLTGKAGAYSVGALAVRTEEIDGVEAKTFFVGRIKRDLLKQSYVGAIYTDGDPSASTSSRTFGTDVHLFTSKLLGREQNFGIDAYILKTANEGVRGEDTAYGFTASYPNDRFAASIDFKHLPTNFRPALGFVPRTNVDKLAISAEFDPRPKDFFNVRQMFHEFFFTQFRRLDKDRVESWRLFTAPINYELNSGEHIEFNYAPQFERLFEPFAIANNVVLPVGDYRFTRWRVEVNTASKRAWKVDVTWWFGSYWSGYADQLTTAFQYKLAPRFQVSVAAEQTFARLRQGNFVARVYVARADYSVSPFLSFFNLVQFDNETRNLGWQSRVRWIIKPGNEVFLVFNQGWTQDERGGFNFKSAEMRLAGKMQYTFRF
ncbi:MAG: DUF5916 domain-containing protein [Blastocatellia bacterium]